MRHSVYVPENGATRTHCAQSGAKRLLLLDFISLAWPNPCTFLRPGYKEIEIKSNSYKEKDEWPRLYFFYLCLFGGVAIIIFL